jgi:dolichol kinase
MLVGLCAATALTLHLMGRRLWCECGRPLIWTANVNSEHNSQHIADPYSFSHILHGVIFFAVLRYLLPTVSTRWRLVIATLIEITWEIVENTPLIINRYRDQTAALGYEGDSIANAVADIACAILGFWLAFRLPWQAALAMVLLFEVVGLLWIRDNLTLNVVMLLYPIDAVREWQSALDQ